MLEKHRLVDYIYIMRKQFFTVMLVFFFFIFSLFSADNGLFTEKDVSKGITVILDCISTSIVGEYTLKNISLPSSSIYVDTKTNLPHRISFFLVDPADFFEIIEKYIKTYTASFNLSSDAEELSPVLISLRDNLSSKHYSHSDYFLTGSVIISYPVELDLEEIYEIFDKSFDFIDEVINIRLDLDLVLFGFEMENPMSVSGIFNLKIDGKEVVFTSIDNYEINNIIYPERIYKF